MKHMCKSFLLTGEKWYHETRRVKIVSKVGKYDKIGESDLKNLKLHSDVGNNIFDSDSSDDFVKNMERGENGEHSVVSLLTTYIFNYIYFAHIILISNAQFPYDCS